ncbi:MAG TPA: shikimate dehydrogenase [Halanaerobiales bacterium]|nr:shikimate dehydrogenase [Halanaerobiales bacterium]
MDKFAFILHPLGFEDFYRKFNWMKKLPEDILKKATKYAPPFKISKITGIKSKTGKKIEGYFYACPLTTDQIINLDKDFVINKIIKTVKKAEEAGVKLIGLGSFTSVVGDKGITINKNSKVPVTTGNSYTVATAIEGTKLAADKMDLDLKEEVVTVVGANGSIGKTVSRLIAKEVNNLLLVSRDLDKLEKLTAKIKNENENINVKFSNKLEEALQKSRIFITVSGAVEALINPQDLLSGSVVCDVARPRDVARDVGKKRDDVLVIEGGIVSIPGNVDFNFNFGVEGQNAYACMAETMLLTLEEKFQSFSLGPDIQIDKVREIQELAKKHGFSLAGLRSYGKLLQEKTIREIKSNSKQKSTA